MDARPYRGHQSVWYSELSYGFASLGSHPLPPKHTETAISAHPLDVDAAISYDLAAIDADGEYAVTNASLGRFNGVLAEGLSAFAEAYLDGDITLARMLE